MSYAVSAALQAAVYQHLVADPALDGLVSGAIYDQLPAGTLPAAYVTLGPESARDRSDRSGNGASHDFLVTVVTDGAGFQVAKEIAAAISDALDDPQLTLARGRLMRLHFVLAKASRQGTGQRRRIDMRFRARVEDE